MTNTITDGDIRVTHKIAASKVEIGEIIASTYYLKVEDVLDRPGLKTLRTTNLDAGAKHIDINGVDLIESSLSADQYSEEITVSKTKAAEILVSSYNCPFTVCWDKADGKERVLRGRLVHPEALLGRSMVEDLDLTDANRTRLVDHRTIKYIVTRGVKYIVK